MQHKEWHVSTPLPKIQSNKKTPKSPKVYTSPRRVLDEQTNSISSPVNLRKWHQIITLLVHSVHSFLQEIPHHPDRILPVLASQCEIEDEHDGLVYILVCCTRRSVLAQEAHDVTAITYNTRNTRTFVTPDLDAVNYGDMLFTRIFRGRKADYYGCPVSTTDQI